MLKVFKLDDANFAQEEGQEAVELKFHIDKRYESKWNEEGKKILHLPANNSSNRQFISEDLFMENAVDNEYILPVKLSGPRVVGGPKKSVVEYLDDEDKEIYIQIVEKAQEAYKEAKAKKTKKALNEMTADELRAMLNALENGETLTIANGPKSFIDCMSDEDREIYVALTEKSQENKANRPKAPRGPLTEEQKAARKAKAKEKKKNEILAMLALLEGEDAE